MGTVDVMMTADFTEMAMVVFSAEPLPVPMTMVPFTILRRNIITGYWSLLRQIRDLQIKIPDLMAPVSSLSGGNQQKVIIGNWLNTAPKIMMYDEPSRGIDVKAKQQIFPISERTAPQYLHQ